MCRQADTTKVGGVQLITVHEQRWVNGSAARFFYCAKANKKDRNEGLDGFEPKREADRTIDDGVGGDNPRNRSNTPKLNHHPTVKPTDLMRYLCRLVTPPNGTVLDPFTGSGSTGKAATYWKASTSLA
jgi:site-specific DNA-methyltransferase (adenine-specific)